MTDSDQLAVSTLILVGDNEYVLCASQGRVLFNTYSGFEASLEQEFTLTLDSSHERDFDRASPEDVAVPIILSTPSTPRFELSTDDSTRSPFESMLSLSSPRTFIIHFRPPQVSESDYAWDNFQDEIVIHAKLSKLVIHLEAWKHAFLPEQENSLLYPASLPDVKAPPLRLFGAIERNAGKKDPAPSPTFVNNPALASKKNNNVDVLLKPRTPRTESLPSLSRPTSRDRQSVNVARVPFPVVTAIQSEREAREVIMKLRRRRNYQTNTEVLADSSPTSVADTALFPETVALDAHTKADLEEFNHLVVAAKDQVMKETAQAKSELSYYQQLLPKPPSRESASETSTTRRPRHMSAANRRPSKLPSLARPSSREAATEMISSVDNQETSSEQMPKPQRSSANQRFMRNTKLESLSASAERSQRSQQQELTTLPTKFNTQMSISDDFDDPDPEVDEAPIVPDDLSGVAALDADDC
ncbi:hypothetical protein PC129_g22975 [Phytophthora cactorum]|uniref:Uncharacterized protein n=1 Tax=Phytophthora cactorum TaxID=29920 RepID=A0A329SVU2_9STRA|nr:hypothetical protein Pcac1_g22410 [Phytophthora cactorum]KAG2793420.1 hypothetical protein PC112_g23450 [Phytophthora cactorum]KAG2802499.1 hypothetical protein PC111_g19084 [Phytophthora cactorum]KAG2802503.1 hypothetical protein PC111_g19073 [Phytophthora cactorum]KAG2814729.1 hypothetical protein PC113_g23282 [Phytophthora cactorum]